MWVDGRQGELRQIVKKRSHFEYLLKRRTVLMPDYLRYAALATVGRGDRSRDGTLTPERAAECAGGYRLHGRH